jgi:hypothetical protein
MIILRPGFLRMSWNLRLKLKKKAIDSIVFFFDNSSGLLINLVPTNSPSSLQLTHYKAETPHPKKLVLCETNECESENP